MISLDQNSRDPLYVQIYDSVRRDITENALKPGEKLMPIRKLAESLDVSRNTVENAYAQLLTEGYVTSRSGSGYVVCDVDFSPLSESSVEKDRAAASRKTKQVTSSAAIGRVTEEGLSGRNAAEHAAARSTKLTSLSPSENRAPHAPAIEFDFTYGDRPRGSFPEVAWRKLTGDALFSVDSKANAYGDGLGEMELRAEIARRIHATRGVNCEPNRSFYKRARRRRSAICSICSTPCATASPLKTPDTTEPWQCFATEDSASRRCPFAPTQPKPSRMPSPQAFTQAARSSPSARHRTNFRSA